MNRTVPSLSSQPKPATMLRSPPTLTPWMANRSRLSSAGPRPMLTEEATTTPPEAALGDAVDVVVMRPDVLAAREAPEGVSPGKPGAVVVAGELLAAEVLLLLVVTPRWRAPPKAARGASAPTSLGSRAPEISVVKSTTALSVLGFPFFSFFFCNGSLIGNRASRKKKEEAENGKRPIFWAMASEGNS